jgi:hypothetical protein
MLECRSEFLLPNTSIRCIPYRPAILLCTHYGILPAELHPLFADLLEQNFNYTRTNVMLVLIQHSPTPLPSND